MQQAVELHDDEALFKDQPLPGNCPICLLPLPLKKERSVFYTCCGSMICNGCIHRIFIRHASEGNLRPPCPYCRSKPVSSAESIDRIKNLMNSGNAYAFNMLAKYYEDGDCVNIPRNFAKANELYIKAGELGCAEAYFNLGNSYKDGNDGVDIGMKKAKHYWELAAKNGDVDARYNLGFVEHLLGNHLRAARHYTLAAKMGHDDSFDILGEFVCKGVVTRDDYNSISRAYQQRCDEMQSMDRVEAEKFSENVT